MDNSSSTVTICVHHLDTKTKRTLLRLKTHTLSNLKDELKARVEKPLDEKLVTDETDTPRPFRLMPSFRNFHFSQLSSLLPFLPSPPCTYVRFFFAYQLLLFSKIIFSSLLSSTITRNIFCQFRQLVLVWKIQLWKYNSPNPLIDQLLTW